MSELPDITQRLAARQPNGRRPQLMNQRWESLLFLHWRLPAARIQQTLPAGLQVDTFEGDAYLGIVPFFMRRVRPIGMPALPWISFFLELNVRTYVFDKRGVPGVWFYSLDCNQPLAVIAARALIGLRYFHAKMQATRSDLVDYSCRRRGSNETARYRYRGLGQERLSDPGSLEFFLLERYYLYAERRGSLVRAQVAHALYRWREAEVRECSEIPAQLDGFVGMTSAAAHSCFVDGFDVRIFAPEKISRDAGAN
jgi:uncharacterized protein YqjF (DUF2071 family)